MTEREDALRGLRAYQKRLAAELKAVEGALAAMSPDGSANTRSRNNTSGNTDRDSSEREGLIREIMSGSDDTWTAQSLVSALTDRGWKSDAANPENSIRTALSRLRQEGAVERVSRGTYRWINTTDSSDPPTATHTGDSTEGEGA